jgi:hypothetical protein
VFWRFTVAVVMQLLVCLFASMSLISAAGPEEVWSLEMRTRAASFVSELVVFVFVFFADPSCR